MKVALLGAKCLPSAGPIDQAVVPLVGLPAASVQSKAAPPQLCTSIPRCCLYHALSALGSLALKKMPPMPVTLRTRTSDVGYLLGTYRSATAPEPNSSRLTSCKSTRFDSPANNVGPWPAILGCTTSSYSSINPSSANASGSVTPPVNSPLPDFCLSCCTAFSRSPRTSSAFQSTWFKVLETTYFFAASLVGAKG